MAEKYELDRWAAVVCNGFTAVNVMSSGNVEELGWDYTEMELDPTGTCGLFDGMLLDWDDDTPAERRDHEAYFPDAFTVGARILADDWDHELGNDEVRSRCFAIIEDADQFTDHDTARDWLCESTCRRAPFLPWRRTEAGTGVLQAGQARTRQEPFTDGGRGEGRRGEPGSPGRWPAAPTRGIIDAVGKAPSVSEGAFLHL